MYDDSMKNTQGIHSSNSSSHSFCMVLEPRDQIGRVLTAFRKFFRVLKRAVRVVF